MVLSDFFREKYGKPETRLLVLTRINDLDPFESDAERALFFCLAREMTSDNIVTVDLPALTQKRHLPDLDTCNRALRRIERETGLLHKLDAPDHANKYMIDPYFVASMEILDRVHCECLLSTWDSLTGSNPDTDILHGFQRLAVLDAIEQATQK